MRHITSLPIRTAYASVAGIFDWGSGMKTTLRATLLAFPFAVLAVSPWAGAAPMKPEATGDQADNLSSAAPDQSELFHSHSVSSDGKVAIGGNTIEYRSVAGTLIVHPKDWDDSAWREKAAKAGDKKDDKDEGKEAEASMFYVAYFKKGAPSADRPITFLFNGGPGSSTVWLHMGAFGPRRVLTPGDTHMAAAPYRLVDNAYSLLDVSDLVFIDAPGTGFSRIAGKDKEKAFYGVDPDANAFAQFILVFLSVVGFISLGFMYKRRNAGISLEE